MSRLTGPVSWQVLPISQGVSLMNPAPWLINQYVPIMSRKAWLTNTVFVFMNC